MYTWIPFFTELATKLLAYEDRQPELVDMLRQAGVQRGLTDQDTDGRKFPLEAIDPFTFLAQIAKYGSARRRPILEELSKTLAVTAAIPDDFEGVPMATAQAAWFFRYAADRDPKAIPLLWKLFREVVPGNVTPSVFDESLKLRQVGRANLTQGMFCANPESYLPVDSQTRPYLDKEGISASFPDYSGYQRILTAVRAKFPGKRFCEISREAWLENNPPPQPNGKQKRGGARYWLYAPGEHARLWDEFYQSGVMGIGWDDLNQDLSKYPSEEMLRKAYREAHGENSTDADFRQLRDFVLRMKPRDQIFVKRGTGELVGFGRVSSDYFYEATRPGYRHLRKAAWARRGEWRIPENMKKLPANTLTEVRDPERIEDLLSLVGQSPHETDNDSGVRPGNPAYSLDQCAAETHLETAKLTYWVQALDRKKQAIIYGPPGTGKTFLAQKLALHLIEKGEGDGFKETLQFHPSYAYEDFIQGLRPRTTASGALDYAMVPGRFKAFCDRARECKGLCVLVIDEVNRAELSRVFGELMYLLEYRNETIPLAGGERFQIPENVRIIGTMNTADRSIALVDHALRRRFAFIRLDPDYDILRRYHENTGFDPEGLISVLERLNGVISDRNYQIGVSFFLDPGLAQPGSVKSIWQMEIEPYVEELFFGKAEKAREFSWDKVQGEILGT